MQEGASKSKRVETPKVDQGAIDAEIKRQEELQKIKDEFTLLDEEKRLGRQSFLSTAEEERFVALEEAIGKEAAVKLQAAENLATTELDLAKAKLGKEKALNAQALKDEQKIEKAKVELQKQTSNQKLSIMRNSFALASTVLKEGSKAQFIVQKVAALAEIAIADGKARGLAIASTAAIPYPANLVALAKMQGLITANTALATGVVAASTIKGFENGGFLGGPTSSGDQTIFAGNKDEVVLNKSQQAEFFNMANGRSSSNQEQSSRPLEITLNVDGRELAKVMRDLRTDGFVA